MRFYLMLVILCVAQTSRAAVVRPSGLTSEMNAVYDNPPVVELVTMGEGGMLWERHGHIALCVRRNDPSLDACYNYGTATFVNPLQMVWGFLRGQKSFWVSKHSPRRTFQVYRHFDRSIWVQPLPFSDEQEARVLEILEHDILEENRFYSYDHFFDNCTTRVRDVIDSVSDSALSNMKTQTSTETFRQLGRRGFWGEKSLLLGLDVALGRVTDDTPTAAERMFLPEFVREAVTEIWKSQPLLLYKRQGASLSEDASSGRWQLALFVFLLTLPVWLSLWRGRFVKLSLVMSVVPMVLLGFILWSLAIISPLPYIRFNEAVLLFMPLDVVLLFASSWRQKYARCRFVMLVCIAALLLVGIFRQPLWAPLLWPLSVCGAFSFLDDKNKKETD